MVTMPYLYMCTYCLLLLGAPLMMTPTCSLTHALASIHQPQQKQLQLQRSNSRYFTQELVLPPLSLVTPAASSLFSNSTMSQYYYDHNAYGDAIPCVYTNSPFTISKWLADNLGTDGSSTQHILGFDIESIPHAPWRTPRRRAMGPVTVQLATKDSTLVVHLLRDTGRPSVAAVPILEAVLSDDSIIKAGVGIDEDMMELCQSWGRLDAKSRLNLGGIQASSSLSPRTATTSGKEDETTGLKRLCKAIVGVDLPKSRQLATADWGHVPLTSHDITYCARDAWAGAAIAHELRLRDPTTFSPGSLTHLLQHQASMEVQTAAAMERKRARSELTTLMQSFRSPQRTDASSSSNNKKQKRPKLPNRVRCQMTKLQSTIKATAPSPPLLFDVSSLGIEIERNSISRNLANLQNSIV